MHTGRFTFTDWVDLDSYFRECWVYQSSEKSDQKVEMTHREVREVLQNQMDLKTRVVGVSDKSRMLGQMVGRMIILSTVSRSGVSVNHDSGDIPCYPHLCHHACVDGARGEQGEGHQGASYC